jgi:flagella basal body P-ring formation protein FlgA
MTLFPSRSQKFSLAFRVFLLLFSSILLLWPVTKSLAQTKLEAGQDIRILNQKVKEFLSTQSVGSPGKVDINTTPIDSNLKLAYCPAPEAFFPAGSRAWGKTTVGLRCNTPNWTIYVQANVSITAEYAVSTMPLSQGQTINANDLVMQKGDITTLPNGIFTDTSQILGRTPKMSLPAGSVLRQDMLKLPTVIQQNQIVRVVSNGNGFSITTEGNALTSATEGQVVQVRMNSGQVINGVADARGQVVVNAK